ncbi:MAG: hypothetical protein M1831_006277 [Alyxoria varia]|nr:MAG: hypothetical protein M1831_006277 [Alyxoria varia]
MTGQRLCTLQRIKWPIGMLGYLADSSVDTATAVINPQTQPPYNASSTTLNGNSAATAQNTPIPHEDILIPPHLQPPNPEDEDDVVPDQHAAFGITQALSAARRGGARPGGAASGRSGFGTAGGRGDRGALGASGPTWRDFESLTDIVRGTDLNDDPRGSSAAGARSGGAGGSGGLAGATRVTNLR